MIKNIKKFILRDQFLHNRINLFLLALVIILNILVWLLWIIKIESLGYVTYLPTEIPIKVVRTSTLPIIGSFFSIINFILAYISTKKEVLISFYLLSASILVEILILVLIRHYIIIAG
jgi:hypothetical protein